MSEAQTVRYVLLTMGRTGSTILSRMLREHPNIVDYQELFNVDYQAEYRRCTSKQTSLKYWLSFPPGEKYRDQKNFTAIPLEASASGILRDYVWCGGYASGIKAVGFKLLYYQLNHDGPYPDLSDAFEDLLPSLRVILLTRDHYLETYLSHLVSSRIRQWHITSERERKPRPRIQIQETDLTHAFEHYDHAWDRLQNLAGRAQSQLTVRYEHLITDRQDCWDRTVKFLGVPAVPMPEVSLKKVEVRTMSEAIVNFDELRRHFSGSKWESFFDYG